MISRSNNESENQVGVRKYRAEGGESQALLLDLSRSP